MVFNSIEFAAFLPVVFLLYWFVFSGNVRVQNFFVVVASYVFYGWWDWRFLLLIAFTSLCSWYSGVLIGRCRQVSDNQSDNSWGGVNDNPSRAAKLVLWLNVGLNLLILGFFKYYNFFVESLVDAFALCGVTLHATTLKLILPVGISFYTFQALSYSIDVYKGKLEPTRDVVEFFAFVSFFPQLVAGPIERATNLLPQFRRERKFDYGEAVDGMRQILWGLFKKVVVADNCAVYVDKVFDTYQTQTGSTLLLAAVLFSFQIYGDFSGYSDIAIGTAKLFGIKLMRNFNVPYFSRDIAEFWRRWHISLTTWFRDYIYIPLGGSRCSKWKVVRNTFVIFLVSGLWHGADWTYVAWGGYHALLFLPLILLGKNRRYRDTVAEGRAMPTVIDAGRILLTFLLVTIGWILFRAGSIAQAMAYIGHLFGSSVVSVPWLMNRTYYVPLAVSIVIMAIVEWNNRSGEQSLSMRLIHNRCCRLMIYLALCIFIAAQNTGTGNQFIYFQF